MVFYNLQNKQKSEENEQFTKDLNEVKSHTTLVYIYLFLIDQIKESTLIEKVKQSKASLGVVKRTGLSCWEITLTYWVNSKKLVPTLLVVDTNLPVVIF